MEHLIVDVEAGIIRRLHDEAERDLAAGFHESAEKKFAAARQAVARSTSIETGTPPGELEPVTRVTVMKQELAERAEIATGMAWIGLRADRNDLLAVSDWTQQPDAPVDREAWAEYRQQLRDLPAKTKDPTKPEWPTPPG